MEINSKYSNRVNTYTNRMQQILSTDMNDFHSNKYNCHENLQMTQANNYIPQYGIKSNTNFNVSS